MENKITVTGTGPYMVTGTMTLTDANGNQIEKKKLSLFAVVDTVLTNHSAMDNIVRIQTG